MFGINRVVKMLKQAVFIILSSVLLTAAWSAHSFATSPALLDPAPRSVSAPVTMISTVADCPLLPGCPSGPSVPLPPMPAVEPQAAEPLVRQAEADQLIEGEGQYRGFVHVQAGTFEMGSPEGTGRVDERPLHKVFLKDYSIAQREVTVREYCRFLSQRGLIGRDKMPRVLLSSPHCPVVQEGGTFRPKEGMADRPMVCVSWYGAADYAKWAGGRLPTSAEWEKAALLSTSNPPGDYLTVLPREGDVPVAIAEPGACGMTGIIGNVWEWCSDWYAADYYAKSPVANPMGPPIGEEKVIRGGSWASPESSKRINNVHRAPPHGWFRTVGFRIVKD
ncbi:MAG: formylglycine-generating enzyme family protein [Desulfomonile sp.]|nr:formylglycine-generating enzyme family protein [Desulfomonile sp.]